MNRTPSESAISNNEKVSAEHEKLIKNGTKKKTVVSNAIQDKVSFISEVSSAASVLISEEGRLAQKTFIYLEEMQFGFGLLQLKKKNQDVAEVDEFLSRIEESMNMDEFNRDDSNHRSLVIDNMNKSLD